MRLFGNFISLIVGLLTSALLLWLIYDSYIDGNYDFAKTVLTSGIGGAVIGRITGLFNHNQQVAGINHVVRADDDPFDDPAFLCRNSRLHFHGLQHHHRVSLPDTFSG